VRLSPFLGPFLVFVVWGAYALLVATWVARRYRGRVSSGLRDALIWALIFAALISFYTFREEFWRAGDRILSELDPGRVSTSGPLEVSVVRRMGGDFIVDALANGRPIRFMFDTGADAVTLRASDAARLGLEGGELDYDVPISTANGSAMAAQSVLSTLQVGDIIERRVGVLVAKPGALTQNLLGRTFLQRLRSYTVRRSRLILRGR